MNQEELQQAKIAYIEHLGQVTRVFNEWAEHINLPVRMSASRAISTFESGHGMGRILPAFSANTDDGIVHEGQLKTAVECFQKLWQESLRCGHVLGAMQSGKTTTSLALQWAGPVLYLLTGERVYPFYLIGNQTNHEDQTKTELNRFLDYYGNLEIHLTPEQSAPATPLNAMFTAAPSLHNYRDAVLRDILQDDTFTIPKIEDIIHRRVGGNQGVRRVADFCRRANEQGYRPLMMIDEPQYGASDRLVANEEEEDGVERRPCVLVQIFDRIEQELSADRSTHWFVGLSATPFELNDLSRVWEVRQHLTEGYSGFNFFNQLPITEGVNITPPTTMGLTTFASQTEIPFIANISMAAYDGSAATFRRHAERVGFKEDQAAYQSAVENALREAIYALLEQYRADDDGPVGLCIRAFNNNARTQALIERLRLDPTRIEVVNYFGGEASGYSVKRAIAHRQRHDLPYIMFVTNRARMADAFPKQVRFFLDFAQKASDLNALLQGLLGRACGYNKRSTVVLSDQNAAILDAYVITGGAYVHRTSRHTMMVGGFRRGAPSSMIKLRADTMNDPLVQQYFAEINSQVVVHHNPDGSQKLRAPRRKRGATGDSFRTGPILSIAETMGLFNHIERPDIRLGLFPQIPTGFNVARASDEVRHSRGGTLKYQLDAEGNCRYTFRWGSRDAAAQGGAAGRARGRRDAAGTHQYMEPTIYVEKYNPETGDIIPKGDDRPGNWRAFMVTFPLREPVREIEAAEIALPTYLCAYDYQMDPQERAIRDNALQPAT
jgi:hypothetical protein